MSLSKQIRFGFLLTMFFAITGIAQEYNNEPSEENPYGIPHPDAPDQIKDWQPLIGECTCESIARVDKDNWADTVMMTWRFKYIMDGKAVQDETLKEDGVHSGSIRQYIQDSARWFVHYYSSGGPTPILSAWEGNKNEDGDIILYKDQTAPNGTPGNYKIVFSDISEDGFNWEGAWVNKDETFIYPTWRIFCTKNE